VNAFALTRAPGLAYPPMAWLLAAVVTAAAPHFVRIPFWAGAMFAVFCLWRVRARDPRGPAFPSGVAGFMLRLAFGAMVLGGVLASYGTLTGRDAGVALLVLLAGMKLAELRGERDYFVAVLIGLFLLLTNFFFFQSLISMAYLLVAVLLFLGALMSANDTRAAVPYTTRLRLAGMMLLQAIPLMLLLFLLFPRVAGPLWGMPRDARAGSTGLDDQMTPGAISELSLSDEVAFRVEFEGPIPQHAALYWRGPVFWFTDGVKWVPDLLRDGTPVLRTSGAPLKYTVTLEPTGKNWIYALEQSPQPPAQAAFTHDLQLRTRAPVMNRMRYALASFTDYRLLAADANEQGRALQLPPGRHRRALELAAQWRKGEPEPRRIVAKALSLFNEQPFYYTLSPPALLVDSVDQFLFESRQGFCEHYAAAFVILMRGAGVPARVVTGYQGGAVNPVGNYLVVRQRDAHAWAEVWLDDRGWVRVDPTAAVAPERIRGGLESALPDALLDVPLGLQDSAIARDLWERMRFTWDAVNNRWNQWVLGYDRNRQSLFLRRIGFDNVDTGDLVLGLTVALTVVLIVLAFWLFRRRGRHSDAARRLYDRFCRVLARRGFPRDPVEGPMAFARRATGQFRDRDADIDRITRLYVAVRYAQQPELLPELRAAVARFR
jgi:transglutaminase-like putative cysteine protease